MLLATCSSPQRYSSSRIFAHNDYEREAPFHTAYDVGVGYIEADVFLEDSDLMVAHHSNVIAEGRTLETLYLKPLLEKVRANEGLAYGDPEKELTLMIDLKTDGVPTLEIVVRQLERYPELISSPTLRFMISGSVPDPDEWHRYPVYIFFDGRPGINYSTDQLERIHMISTNFRQHATWDGHGPLPDDERRKILDLVEDAHRKGKKFRFWATPDFPEAWRVLMELNMDVIVTDDVTELSSYLGR